MNDSLSFDIDASHFYRQLKPDADRTALAALGQRCAGYLRRVAGPGIDPQEVPRLFLGMLQPSRVPVERSTILGVYFRSASGEARPPRLTGVLYFLHPLERNDTWFITLLLLEPGARGRGLGSACHRAFERWAASRGARRFVVAVADHNPRAWHFWRERMGYQEIEPVAWQHAAELKHREMELRLNFPPVPASAWRGRAAHDGRE